MQVIKRDGTIQEFDSNKIKTAILKAFDACCPSELPEDLDGIIADMNFWDGIEIEDIQDIVIETLQDYGYDEVATSYASYRNKQSHYRELLSKINYQDEFIDSSDNAASASETDANANVSSKNVATLEGEDRKRENREIQRYRMKRQLKKQFPEVASQYSKDLENHIIYTHDEASTSVLKPYCMAASLYPLMMEGVGNIDMVTPTPPNDIQSYSGQITNLIFLLSSQCKGAVAVGEYLIALNYYINAEFGIDWYTKLDSPINNDVWIKHITVKDYIKKGMKQFIYGVNQPAGNRSFNSPFSNISYYDKTYFHALFEDFYYPDNTQPQWEAIDCLQRMFMELHRELRLIKPLTFPVTTMAMVHDGSDIIDQEYKKLCAEEWAKGGSFFCYLSDNPSSLASCCFSEDTKFLWKSSTNGVNISTFKEFEQMPYKNTKENFKIFHNGSWIEGKVISLENRPMYKVTTYNNKEFIMTDNHINVTLKGEKQTSQLSTDDYLLFNTNELQAVPENDEHLTFAQGFVIGAFLGDGSFGSEVNGTIYETIISQNDNKGHYCIKQFEKALKHLRLDSNVNVGKIHNNVLPIKICSKKLVAFIQKWTHWERGTYSFNKRLNLDCLLQSVDFRKGILAGWYNTDGGNSNRCYTTSSKLAEDMEALITSLGMQSIINISDRTNEKVIIRNKEYNRNYPLYCVRWYEKANHRTSKDKERGWVKKNNSIYFKIKSIEPYQYDNKVYCIQCKNTNEPYFTLPSGLITHNCRVLNEIQENTFSSINGLQGIMTGSANVITLNINRIVQDWFRQKGGDENPREYDSLKEYISNILERVYKYHIAYKTMLYEWEAKGAFASSNAGYIYLRKLYSTIGIIGYCEAAQFLGLEINDNKEYKEFLQLIFGTIKEQNKLHSIHDKKRPFLFNSEAIPKLSGDVKLLLIDLEVQSGDRAQARF